MLPSSMPPAAHKQHISVGHQGLLNEPPSLAPVLGTHLLKELLLFLLSADKFTREQNCYQEVMLDSILVCLESFIKLLSGFTWKFSFHIGTPYVFGCLSPACSQITSQRLDITYKCSAKSSGLLLADFYT